MCLQGQELSLKECIRNWYQQLLLERELSDWVPGSHFSLNICLYCLQILLFVCIILNTT